MVPSDTHMRLSLPQHMGSYVKDLLITRHPEEIPQKRKTARVSQFDPIPQNDPPICVGIPHCFDAPPFFGVAKPFSYRLRARHPTQPPPAGSRTDDPSGQADFVCAVDFVAESCQEPAGRVGWGAGGEVSWQGRFFLGGGGVGRGGFPVSGFLGRGVEGLGGGGGVGAFQVGRYRQMRCLWKRRADVPQQFRILVGFLDVLRGVACLLPPGATREMGRAWKLQENRKANADKKNLEVIQASLTWKPDPFHGLPSGVPFPCWDPKNLRKTPIHQ